MISIIPVKFKFTYSFPTYPWGVVIVLAQFLHHCLVIRSVLLEAASVLHWGAVLTMGVLAAIVNPLLVTTPGVLFPFFHHTLLPPANFII
jgi:hypothetical protein